MLRGNISIIIQVKGLYGPEHHIVEVNGDVADAGKITNRGTKKDIATQSFTIVERLLQPRK